LSGFFAARQHEVKALNPIGAQPGEEVIVGIHESVLVWGSAWLYLFPLLSLLAGSLLAKSAAGFFALNGGELPVILGGLAGMLAGFFGLHAYQTYRSAKGTDQTRQQAVILRRMANADVLHFIPGKSQVN